MTTAKLITIHEFSTGIQAQRTYSGNWVSQGFTGKYMNSTLDPIPSVVRKAISNRLFAVAEGASRDEPTLIGREITENDETWSVIAVVTKGTDDGGRSASLYRYFLSEGRNQLTPILRWLLSTKKDYVFNPFDYQEIGQPHQADKDRNSPPVDKKENLIELLEDPAPIIFPSDQNTSPLIVNRLAERKAEENGYPIAWAYKVEALEKPRTFQVIYSASAKAEQVLVKTLASTPNTPTFIENEQDLNTAVKAIFRKGKIQLEHLLILEDALQNPQITDEYWENVFHGQGANEALSKGIYSAQMVRLLALQSVILPATLPRYLGWLEKREKNDEFKKTFIDFQKQLREVLARVNPESEFLHLKEKVIAGVRLIIPFVVKQPELLLNPVVSLLKPQNGLWGYFYHYQVKQEIEQDLKTAPLLIQGYQPDASLTLVEAEPLWEELFQNIKSIWERDRVSPKEKYFPLAEFFEQVSYFEASALFYHIAWGEVPGKVFNECQGRRGRGHRKAIYGIIVKKHITFFEKLWNELVEIGGIIVPVYIFAPLLIVTFILGGFALPRTPLVGNVFAPKSEEKTAEINVPNETNTQTAAGDSSSQKEAETENNPQISSQESTQTNQEGNANSQSETNQPQPILEPAVVNEFDTQTRKSIRMITKDQSLFTVKDKQRLENQNFSDQDNYLDVLRNEIFNNPNLQIIVILEDSPPDSQSLQKWQTWKKQWIDEVKDYQQNLGSNVIDGIITPEAGTYKAIRKQLQERKQKLNKSPSNFQDPNI